MECCTDAHAQSIGDLPYEIKLTEGWPEQRGMVIIDDALYLCGILNPGIESDICYVAQQLQFLTGYTTKHCMYRILLRRDHTYWIRVYLYILCLIIYMRRLLSPGLSPQHSKINLLLSEIS